jgi:hypothetical protein
MLPKEYWIFWFRQSNWRKRKARMPKQSLSGVLEKYAAQVGSAFRGAVSRRSAQMKLGYVGVGLMGKPMVLRLLAAGREVTVWNRSHAKLAPVLEKAREGRRIASGRRARFRNSHDVRHRPEGC